MTFGAPGAERSRGLIIGLSWPLWARSAQMTPLTGKSFRKSQQHTKKRMHKGSFRTKNTTTIAKIVSYYAAVFLLRPQILGRGPFFERKNVCNSQENGVRTRCAAIVNHPAVLKILRVVNLLRVVFLVRRGPLGVSGDPYIRRRCVVMNVMQQVHVSEPLSVKRFCGVLQFPPPVPLTEPKESFRAIFNLKRLF